MTALGQEYLRMTRELFFKGFEQAEPDERLELQKLDKAGFFNDLAHYQKLHDIAADLKKFTVCAAIFGMAAVSGDYVLHRALSPSNNSQTTPQMTVSATISPFGKMGGSLSGILALATGCLGAFMSAGALGARVELKQTIKDSGVKKPEQIYKALDI